MAGCVVKKTAWLAWCDVSCLLFGQNQFVVAGDPEAVFFSGMNDDQFPDVLKQFFTGDAFVSRHLFSRLSL